MQFYFLPSLCISIAILFLSNVAQAELIVDSSLSVATVAVGAVSDTTTTSGTLDLQVSPGTSPFSTAQITDLDLTLDEALSFGLGLATLNTDPASISIELLSAGPAGSVNDEMFDQQGNILGVSGQGNLVNLFGGSTPIDLDTLGAQNVDFNNILITESGGIVTVDASYSFAGVTNGLNVNVNGRVVASGPATAVPEPTTAGIIGTVSCLAFLRRRRS